jgi:ABC-type polysaccharide/polyol phosphate export permease
LFMVALTTGFCLVLSALHVYFRDIRYIVSASLIIWMYVTPVVYPPNDAPHILQTIIAINPATGVIDLFHMATVGAHGSVALALMVSGIWTLGLLLAGVGLQARFNRVFSDLL